MNNYEHMCIAANLNYYRKMPTIEELQKMSGLTEEEFKNKIKLSRKILKIMIQPTITIEEFTLAEIKELDEIILAEMPDELLAVNIIMCSRGRVWMDNRWVSNKEYLDSL